MTITKDYRLSDGTGPHYEANYSRHHVTAHILCPKTGLSQTVIDDYAAILSDVLVISKESYLVSHPEVLFNLMRTKAHTLPASYVIAAIFLKADEIGILQPESGPSANTIRPKVAVQLAADYTLSQLRALYYRLDASKVPLMAKFTKVSLIAAGTNVYNLLMEAANQELSEHDKANLTRPVGTLTMKRRAKRVKREKARMDMSPTAVLKRTCRNIGSIINAIPASDEFNYGDKQIAGIRRNLMHYNSVQPIVRKRLLEVIKHIRYCAVGEMIIDRDGVDDRTLQAVIKLLETEAAPIELHQEEF